MQVVSRFVSLRRLSAALAVVQFGALAWFGFVEVRDADLTLDFGIFYRAYTAISNGNFNPAVSSTGITYLRDHAALLTWPLALLGLLSQSPLVLKFVQAGGIAIASYVGALWSIELIEEQSYDRKTATAFALSAIVTIFVMPWPYWEAAFDFHFYALLGALLVAASRWLYRGHYRYAWPALAAALMCTEVAAPLVASLGISLAVARPRAWRYALGMVVVAVAYLYAVEAIVAPVGSQIVTMYGWLVPESERGHLTALGIPLAIAAHPVSALREIMSARWEAYASLAPGGFLGIAAPWTMGPVLLTCIENLLASGGPSSINAPGFQYGAIYALLVPGFVSLVAVRRPRVPLWCAQVAFGLLAVNAAGWGAVWLQILPHAWFTTSPAAASALHELRARIGPSAEIVVSNGSLGIFARNPSVTEFVRDKPIPIVSDDVHLIVEPFDGIEFYEPSEALAMVQGLLKNPKASLETSSGNVWSFTYHPDAGEKTLTVTADTSLLYGGLFRTGVGTHDLSQGLERSSTFVAGDNEREGFLAESIVWRIAAGDYVVRTRLSCTTTCIVEVRDATADRVLATRAVQHVAPRDESFDVAFVDTQSDAGPSGWGPFYSPAVDERPGSRLELRVFVPMHATARIFDARIRAR